MPEDTQGYGNMAGWLKGKIAGGIPQPTIGGDSKLGQMMMGYLNSNPGVVSGYLDQMFGGMPMHPGVNATMGSGAIPGMGGQQQSPIGFANMFMGGGSQPTPSAQAPVQQPFTTPQQSANPMPQNNAYAQRQPFRRPLSSYLGDTPSMLMQGNPYARGFGK